MVQARDKLPPLGERDFYSEFFRSIVVDRGPCVQHSAIIGAQVRSHTNDLGKAVSFIPVRNSWEGSVTQHSQDWSGSCVQK